MMGMIFDLRWRFDGTANSRAGGAGHNQAEVHDQGDQGCECLFA
jgi:hypothetical protein